MDHKHKRYQFISHGWNEPKSQIQQADGKCPVGINKIGITPKTLQGSPVLTNSLQGINCKNFKSDYKDIISTGKLQVITSIRAEQPGLLSSIPAAQAPISIAFYFPEL